MKGDITVRKYYVIDEMLSTEKKSLINKIYRWKKCINQINFIDKF